MTTDCRHRIDHAYGCAIGRRAPRDCGGCRSYDPAPDRGIKGYVATMALVSVAIMTTIGVTALMMSSGWR